MTNDQLTEFADALRIKFPNYSEINVNHLGRFRVQITIDHGRTVVMCLSDEDIPTQWATHVAKQLATRQVMA